jgi:hypothetical protein
MQNLIKHIIKEEKATWSLYLFACQEFGSNSSQAISYQSRWYTYKQLIEDFNLNTPKRNLSTFKHKKYTINKSVEV